MPAWPITSRRRWSCLCLSSAISETIEEAVNAWVAQGWQLEGIRFVTTEHSKRPAMAFVSFTRDAPAAAVDREPPRKPPPLVDDDDPAVISAGHADVE